jgi:hypothetical protein
MAITVSTALADLKTIEDNVKSFQANHISGTDRHLNYRAAIQRILEDLQGIRQMLSAGANANL